MEKRSKEKEWRKGAGEGAEEGLLKREKGAKPLWTAHVSCVWRNRFYASGIFFRWHEENMISLVTIDLHNQVAGTPTLEWRYEQLVS